MTASERRGAEFYRKSAKAWDAKKVLAIWEGLKEKVEIQGWEPGKTFEYMVIRAFDIEKVKVRWPYEVTYPQKFGTMEQIDGIVYERERAFLVESKNMSEPAAIESLAKMRLRLEARPPGTMGILFSASDFTIATEIFAQFATPLNVILWSRGDLDFSLNPIKMRESSERKLTFAIEEGLPLFSLGG